MPYDFVASRIHEAILQHAHLPPRNVVHGDSDERALGDVEGDPRRGIEGIGVDRSNARDFGRRIPGRFHSGHILDEEAPGPRPIVPVHRPEEIEAREEVVAAAQVVAVDRGRIQF